MIPISKPVIGEDEINAVEQVLRSGFLVQHGKTEEFEKEFSSYIGTKSGVATSSGTAALMIALASLGIGKGGEVITTPFTFQATANSILYVGARPVFADIGPRTFNIDPDSLEEKITEKTKAIMPVHLYGQPCDMMRLQEICYENRLLLIEDAAQAHGAEYNGRKAGSFGDASAFSFYATKNLVTAEGGMVMTNSRKTAELARKIRNHGQSEQYLQEMLSYNFRMTDINAALGLVQLKKLDFLNARRAENAEFFTENLSNIGWLETPFVPDNVKPSWHQYTLKILNGKRDEFLKYMNGNGIGCRVYYPMPVYMQPFYQSIGFEEGLCPIAERVSKQVVSIPVGPHLTEDDREFIVETIKGFDTAKK